MNASSLLFCWQDLANFTPFPDEWTVEDKVLFEQAFQFHGKSFHRIRQMLPDKSIAQLVKYYYGWKKTRTRTSLMDRQARKLQVQREQGSVPTGEFNLKVPPTDQDSRSETLLWGRNIVLIWGITKPFQKMKLLYIQRVCNFENNICFKSSELYEFKARNFNLLEGFGDTSNQNYVTAPL